MRVRKNLWLRLGSTAALSLLFFALALFGCGRGGSSGPPKGGVPEVTSVTVKTERIILTTELPGRTSAYRVAEIRPQVSGLIKKRLFTEGSEIQAGDLLYQIDPQPFEAALDNANAALGRAEANLPALRARVQRFKDLLTDKSVSQQDYDDAEGALRQAEADTKFWKASAETARINLGYTRITSPISGRIGRSAVTDGAIVTSYQPTPLAVVQQFDPIYVDVNQSTSELLNLQKRIDEGKLAHNESAEKKVRLILQDDAVYPLSGTLQFRDVSVDPTTATVVLRMVFPNPQQILLPGMFVRAIVEEGSSDNTILIPQQCIVRDPKGNPGVLVINAESKAERRALVLDRAIGDKWVVSSGLAPGDKVIMEGIQRVRPGMPVKEAAAVATDGQMPSAAAADQKQSRKE